MSVHVFSVGPHCCWVGASSILPRQLLHSYLLGYTLNIVLTISLAVSLFWFFFLFFLQENLIWFLFILCGNDGSYVCNCRRPSPIHTIPEVVTLTFESRCTLFSRKPARWVASWNFRVNSTHARRCVYVRYASEYYIPTLHTKQNTLTNISLPRGNAFMNWWLCRSSRECNLSFLTSPCLHQCIYVGMKTIYVIYGNMVTLIYTSRDEKL